jgi:hypothetical protein
VPRDGVSPTASGEVEENNSSSAWGINYWLAFFPRVPEEKL